MHALHIIKRPLITEKSMTDATAGKFTFLVDRSAHKNAIKYAVEKTFSVHVTAVVTSMVKGKTKRTGKRRTEVVEGSVKRATVTLATGEKIALFDIGATK